MEIKDKTLLWDMVYKYLELREVPLDIRSTARIWLKNVEEFTNPPTTFERYYDKTNSIRGLGFVWTVLGGFCRAKIDSPNQIALESRTGGKKPYFETHIINSSGIILVNRDSGFQKQLDLSRIEYKKIFFGEN